MRPSLMPLPKLLRRPGRAAGVATLAAVAVSAPWLSAPASAAGTGVQVPAALPRTATSADMAQASTVTLNAVLAGADTAGLTALANRIVDPASPDYHRYVTPAVIAARFGAPAPAVSAVVDQLGAAGLHAHVWADGMGVTVSGTAAAVQAAFHTQLRTGTVDGRQVYANTTAATLPAGLVSVSGLDDVAAPKGSGLFVPISGAAPGARRDHATGCMPSSANAYAPSQVAATYGMSGTGAGTTIAVFELADFSDADLSSFAGCAGIPAPSVTRVAVDGGGTVGSGTVEATMDVEELAALVPGAKLDVYEAPDNLVAMLDVYRAMINDDRASIITTSWGLCEAMEDPSVASAENVLFQQAAAQGQTVLAASGDSGSQDCGTTSGAGLQVDDPASQPWVTGVGGTTLASVAPRAETVWNHSGSGSGGGPSHRWPVPAWQKQVAGSLGATDGSCGGSPCRTVPDVSASADPANGYILYCTAGDCAGAGWVSGGGTSLASPLWAALVADVAQTCPTPGRFGLINPALYSAAATNDITVGTNAVTAAAGGAFPAGAGYDLATGLGTPEAAQVAAALCRTPAAAPPATPTTDPTTTTASTNRTNNTAPPTGSTPTSAGYWLASGDGQVLHYGDATSVANVAATAPIVGIAPTLDRQGAWLVQSDGRVLTTGDAANLGSLSGPHAPIVGIAATPDGNGYWLAASDGGVFTFGDAGFFGSAGALHLVQPVVGMAATPDGNGYWLVAADGGIFTYGDAGFFGSAGGLRLVEPVVGIAPTGDGHGYWLVASDGGIFTYGDAPFVGSIGGHPLVQPVVGMAATPDGHGYWQVAADGGIFTYGDAGFYGSAGGAPRPAPVVGMTSA